MNKKDMFVLVFIIVTFFMLIFSNITEAASVTLAFDPPTESADGSELDDLAGYTLYWGVVSGGPYTESCSTPDITATTVDCDIPGAENVTLYFVLTATDEEGNESGYSNEVSVPFQGIPPAAPTNLRLVQ